MGNRTHLLLAITVVKYKYPRQSQQDFPFDWGFGFIAKKIAQMKSDAGFKHVISAWNLNKSVMIVPQNENGATI